ncbi:MAG: hypothetical protein J0H68_09790 [Sphingobacteriia bacterium]|nr:hypothetical protein [Sphingobacteriia bacterium]
MSIKINLSSLERCIGYKAAKIVLEIHYFINPIDVLNEKEGIIRFHKAGYKGKNTLQKGYLYKLENKIWFAQSLEGFSNRINKKIKMSLSTFRKYISDLEEAEFITVKKFDKSSGNHTKFYTINYEKLEEFGVKLYKNNSIIEVYDDAKTIIENKENILQKSKELNFINYALKKYGVKISKDIKNSIINSPTPFYETIKRCCKMISKVNIFSIARYIAKSIINTFENLKDNIEDYFKEIKEKCLKSEFIENLINKIGVNIIDYIHDSYLYGHNNMKYLSICVDKKIYKDMLNWLRDFDFNNEKSPFWLQISENREHFYLNYEKINNEQEVNILSPVNDLILT